jgi:hypothetical protein
MPMIRRRWYWRAIGSGPPIWSRRLYRRSIGESVDAETRDLLEDVERVLAEIANGPEDETSNDLSGVRARISDQDLIFRLRVMTAEMRDRERRARPTW